MARQFETMYSFIFVIERPKSIECEVFQLVYLYLFEHNCDDIAGIQKSQDLSALFKEIDNTAIGKKLYIT